MLSFLKMCDQSAAVSIPSGRGFWAGPQPPTREQENDNGLNPLWSGLLGRPKRVVDHVSWCASLNPLWSGLLGRRTFHLSNTTASSGLNPLWSGLLGRPPSFGFSLNSLHLVSIPSGRGFWAGPIARAGWLTPAYCLNPLWSGLLGRPKRVTDHISWCASLNPLWSGLLGRLSKGVENWVDVMKCLNPLWSGLLGRLPCQWWQGSANQTSQSPLVGASGPAQWSGRKCYLVTSVSIPSGRGFWAGQSPHSTRVRCGMSLNPLWSGLLGRPWQWQLCITQLGESQSPLVGASGPAESGMGTSVPACHPSQSPLVGASGPAYSPTCRFAVLSIVSQSPLVGASGPAVKEIEKLREEK